MCEDSIHYQPIPYLQLSDYNDIMTNPGTVKIFNSTIRLHKEDQHRLPWF